MWTQERKMKGNRNNRGDLVLAGVLLLSLGTAWAEDRGAENRVVPPFIVSVKDTTLSVKIENVPLGEVLKELTRQAHLEVYLGASSAEEKISARFDNLPLEEGIKRLLRGKNYTLTYARTAASPRVAEIRVIANGSGPITKITDETASVSPAAKAGSSSPEERPFEELAQQALQAPEPAARIAALKALGERGEEEKSRSTVASALRDQNTGVRGMALELVQQGLPVPLEAVHEMALHDTSPELRINALDTLVDLSDTNAAMEYLKKALQDPDPQIKTRVQHMLQRVAEEAEAEAASSNLKP
jgi:HEAT repeat protein